MERFSSYSSCWEILIVSFEELKKQPRTCSVRKGVLRNFAKFTGNTCARVSFLKKLQAWGLNFIQEEALCARASLFNNVAGLRPQLYYKRNSGTCVFLWLWLNFEEHLFYRTLPGDYFWQSNVFLCKSLYGLPMVTDLL